MARGNWRSAALISAALLCGSTALGGTALGGTALGSATLGRTALGGTCALGGARCQRRPSAGYPAKPPQRSHRQPVVVRAGGERPARHRFAPEPRRAGRRPFRPRLGRGHDPRLADRERPANRGPLWHRTFPGGNRPGTGRQDRPDVRRRCRRDGQAAAGRPVAIQAGNGAAQAHLLPPVRLPRRRLP